MTSGPTAFAPVRAPLPVRIFRRGLRGISAFLWRRKLKYFGVGAMIARPHHFWGEKYISIGDHVAIWRYSRVDALGNGPDFEGIEIGEGCKIQPFVHIAAVEKVTLGKGVLIASHVYITDHDHDFSDPYDPPIWNKRVVSAPTCIEDYVWLGEGVMVLKGVTIGERSIIGAGSIVTKDIPSFSIAVGTPARVIQVYDHDTKEWVKAPK